MIEDIKEYNECRKILYWQPWKEDIRLAPSLKQVRFARTIAFSLKIDVSVLEFMDKYDMSEFISNHLDEYNAISMGRYFKEKRQKHERYLHEEVLNENGMDASDFGIYAWGDS